MKNARSMVVDLVCLLLLIALCLTIAGPRWNRGIDWGDEGFLAYGAVRVIHGEMPHRDFVSLQPPLSFYTVALVFKLFGTSLATLRAFGLSIFLALVLLIYANARRLTTPLLALCAAAPATMLSLAFFNFVPFAVWQGIVATLGAVFFYLSAIARKRSSLAFAAGISTALSLLARHDQAAYLMMSILLLSILCAFATEDFSPRQSARLLAVWLVAIAIVLLPLTFWWWTAGALPAMWHQLVLFPFSTYVKTSGLPWPVIPADAPVAEILSVLLFYFPPVLSAVAALWFLQRITRGRFAMREALLGFVLAWTVLFYLQALTRSDLNHLLITLPPAFILAVFCWRICLDALGDRAVLRVVFSLIAIAIATVELWLVRPKVLLDPATSAELLDLKTGGVYVEGGIWITNFVRSVQGYVPPDRPILALIYQPMFYFLCERRNPTRWNYLWPGDQTAEEHRELVRQAKHDPPGAVLLTGEEQMASFIPEIIDYVHADFHREGEFGRLNLYLPNEATP